MWKREKNWWRGEGESDIGDNIKILKRECSGNLLSFLLRCGTRPYERGTQWERECSGYMLKIFQENEVVITKIIKHQMDQIRKTILMVKEKVTFFTCFSVTQVTSEEGVFIEANLLDCEILVSEFAFQFYCKVYFRTYILRNLISSLLWFK